MTPSIDATITTPDSQTIAIQPFDIGSLASIEKAIATSDLGFTPNNDGINDKFDVKVNSISNYEIHVYSRWGEKIFHSHNELNSWDGLDFNGVVVPNGVYLYHINIIDQNGKDWAYNGEINLLR